MAKKNKKSIPEIMEDLRKAEELTYNLSNISDSGELARIESRQKGEFEKQAEKSIQAQEGLKLLKKQTNSPIINYANLDIELGLRQYDHYTYFRHSLKKLKEAGYERHLMPQECFKLFIDYFEGKLQGDLAALTSDMLESRGEWFHLFWERKENKLFCYVINKDFCFKDIKKDFWGDIKINRKKLEKKLEKDNEFDISGIPSDSWINLKHFSDELVEYFYTRKFEDLPEQMKGNDKFMPRIWLPSKGVLKPIHRSKEYKFGIASSDYAASRGVRNFFNKK